MELSMELSEKQLRVLNRAKNLLDHYLLDTRENPQYLHAVKALWEDLNRELGLDLPKPVPGKIGEWIEGVLTELLNN